ncbi:MAG: GNAT family N-acetyltransferase [Anaerolineae bacterium]
MITIFPARTSDHIQQALALSQEYVDEMLANIREHWPDFDIQQFVAEHDYDDVRKKFPGDHIPPYGRLLLAATEAGVGGCIALGKLSDSVCEMRTLYVRPAFRGTGMGRQLAQAVIDEARHIGYTHMRLDTLKFMHSAQSLYRSLGFEYIPPYIDLPDALKQHIVFLECDL